MGKRIDTAKSVVDLVSVGVNVVVAVVDVRRRSREEDRKAQQESDDKKRIKELEAELERLRAEKMRGP